MLAFGALSRALQIAVLLVLLALAPLRALATATVGFCAMNQETAASSSAAHAGHGESHSHDEAPANSGMHEHCNTCAEHCASAALVSLPELALPAEAHGKPVRFLKRAAPAFFPDPLDPPPLAG